MTTIKDVIFSFPISVENTSLWMAFWICLAGVLWECVANLHASRQMVTLTDISYAIGTKVLLCHIIHSKCIHVPTFNISVDVRIIF